VTCVELFRTDGTPSLALTHIFLVHRSVEFRRESVSDCVRIILRTLTCPVGLVVEDAPSGVASGLAAGCAVIGLITSHTKEQMEAKCPTYLVENLSRCAATVGNPLYIQTFSLS
jgi:hypothetical protein